MDLTHDKKPQAPAEFLCFHVGLHGDRHWGCAYPAGVWDTPCFPKGRLPSWAPIHRGGARMLLSPSGNAALILHTTSISFLPAGQAQRYQPADTFLLLPAAVTTLPFWAHFRSSTVPCWHTAHGCPTPGVNPNAIPIGNKTPFASWLSQHWNRALQSSKAHPLALFVFGNRQ